MLPALDDEYVSSASQSRQYREQGYIVLRGVLSDVEAQSYLCFLKDRYRDTLGDDSSQIEGRSFYVVRDIHKQYPQFCQFAYSRRLAKIAADLMDVDSVRLLFDQLIVKPGHTCPTSWHQDQASLCLDTNNVITLWIAMMDISQDMGSVRFATGAHEAAVAFGKLGLGKNSEYAEAFLIQSGYDIPIPESYKAGDISAHSGWTPHSTSANGTRQNRIAFNLVYYESGAKVADTLGWQECCQKFFPGKKPLDAADNRPIVFPTQIVNRGQFS